MINIGENVGENVGENTYHTAWAVLATPIIGLFVDATLTGNITDGTYSVANRDNSGSQGNAYRTVSAAVNAAAIGNTIYMRGGTYFESAITLSNVQQGTSWADGEYFALVSHPGEWAILDGGGSTADIPMIQKSNGANFDKRNLDNENSFWKFERFEITNIAMGFWMSGGPQWYRYLYIHDLASDAALRAAIAIMLPHDCIIEFCNFYNNNQTSATNPQYAHIMFDADYRDDELPGTFDSNVCTKKNIIRYNFLDTSMFGIHYKNQQRFGIDIRDPAQVAEIYGTWGDDVHHNIILNSDTWSIKPGQDNIQIHHNIVTDSMSGQYGAGQIIYNRCLYNNTTISRTNHSLGLYGPHSGITESGNGSLTFFDQGGTQVVHPTDIYLNNIISENVSGYRSHPFVMCRDMPANTSSPLLERSGIVIEHNLVHNCDDNNAFMIGRNYDGAYPLCENQMFTVPQFNTCSESWRSLAPGAVINWDVDGELYALSGSGQYVADPTFAVDGTHTVADGGKGGNHPFLLGVTLPSYLGATNPLDHAWVEGLYTDVRNKNWMMNQTTDPAWLEK